VIRIRVATFNVCNLFLPGSLDLGQGQGATVKRRAELRALARGLELADADVVALQEVGSLAALAAVNQLLSQPYPYLYLIPGNSVRGIHLAFASRFPGSLSSHRHLDLRDERGEVLEDYATAADAAMDTAKVLRLQRDLLRLDLCINDRPISLFNLHLKSPNQPRWCRLTAQELRLAECRLVAGVTEQFETEQPGSALLVLGDFNDPWPAAALQPLAALGLRRPQRHTAASSAESYWPRAITIDHILLNAAALELSLDSGWQVIDDKRARRGSDHCPVVLELQIPDASGA
jgi:endonuclease/exonuclease/phosphatase family metal-dependent hydrolase